MAGYEVAPAYGDASMEHSQQPVLMDPEPEHGHGHGGSSFKSLIAGGVGGTWEVLTDHPIDLVKVRMQTAQKAASQHKVGVVGTLSRILHSEGLPGLYRGASVRVATLMPACAISFWGLDVGKQLVVHYETTTSNGVVMKSFAHESDFSIGQVAWAGAFSALPVTLFATPSERIKCLLQIQQKSASAAAEFSGPLDCARHLYRTGGITSLYRGLSITLMRNVPGYSAWFASYEYCKRHIMQYQGLNIRKDTATFSSIVLSGGIAGSFSWLVMIPFDGIKSRIQTSAKPASIVKTFHKLTAGHGLGALFRGWKPAVLIAFPANAACFLGMELAWRGLSAVENGSAFSMTSATSPAVR